MTVIPFRPRDGRPPEADNTLFFLTLCEHSTYVTEPNDGEVDKTLLTHTLFDSTFHVLNDTDDCVALISLGAEYAMTYREPDSFDTAEHRRWLRERLDYVYESFTGRHRNPIRAFFSRLFPSKGDDK